jgi:hypothetical protein
MERRGKDNRKRAPLPEAAGTSPARWGRFETQAHGEHALGGLEHGYGASPSECAREAHEVERGQGEQGAGGGLGGERT